MAPLFPIGIRHQRENTVINFTHESGHCAVPQFTLRQGPKAGIRAKWIAHVMRKNNIL
jgi:hypothetical protein